MEAATVGSKIATLVLRVLTFVLLSISLILTATNSKTILEGTEYESKAQFNKVYAYRYMLAVATIGITLNLLQIAFTIYHMVVKGDGNCILFDFFSDKLLSYFLLSGGAAGLGAGIDLNTVSKKIYGGDVLNSFFAQANAAAALLLIAFLCSAIVSVLSFVAAIRKP